MVLQRRLRQARPFLDREQMLLFEMEISPEGVPENLNVLAGGPETVAPHVAAEALRRLREDDSPVPDVEFDVELEISRGEPSSWRTTVFSVGRNGRVMIAARDVTDARSHLKVLEETESLYHSLLELLPEPVLFTDLQGTLLYINPAGAALLGVTDQKDLIGTSIWSHVHPEDLQAMRASARRLVKGQAFEEAQIRFIRNDGALVVVEANSVATRYEGRPAVLSTARDVTDKGIAASQIRESKETLARIFHASPAAVSVTRLRDGRILDVNQAWLDLTGHERSLVLDVPVRELGLFEDAEVADDLWRRVVEEDQVTSAELIIRRKDGQTRTILCSTQQIRMLGERAVLMVMSDITSRKSIELKLVEARDQAREMARIKSSFLTNMTHEIRTPLTVILGFTSMLRQGVDPAYRRFVNVIERSGKRLLLTLDSILDLAQLEAGSVQVDRTPFRVHDAVESVVGAVEPLAREKGLTIDFKGLEQPAFVAGGHKIFTRIIHHLLDNAVKFTEAGAIRVRVESGDQVAIVVSDTGIGIRSEFLPHVFEEFSQESTGLERTHQGSGLGLAVSRRLAEAMGGRIDVESEKGKGSTFRLSLPRAEVPVSV